MHGTKIDHCENQPARKWPVVRIFFNRFSIDDDFLRFLFAYSTPCHKLDGGGAGFYGEHFGGCECYAEGFDF